MRADRFDAKRARVRRETQRRSGREVAAAAGISHVKLYRWETGLAAISSAEAEAVRRALDGTPAPLTPLARELSRVARASERVTEILEIAAFVARETATADVSEAVAALAEEHVAWIHRVNRLAARAPSTEGGNE